MKHPKAKNELPDQVRVRVEETRRKLRKASTALTENDGALDHDRRTVATQATAVSFPAFPDLSLSILKGTGRAQAKG
jgi:hypothetical protein